MCDDCDWESAAEQCSELIDQCDELPDAASDFADSVKEKIESIAAWIEENGHVTSNQQTALDNMGAGINRWLERS